MTIGFCIGALIGFPLNAIFGRRDVWGNHIFSPVGLSFDMVITGLVGAVVGYFI